MTPQEAELLKEQIAETLKNTVEVSIKIALSNGAYILSVKHGLNGAEIASWMQETLDETMKELKERGL